MSSKQSVDQGSGSTTVVAEDPSDFSDVSDQDEPSIKGKGKGSTKDPNKPVKRRSSKACECDAGVKCSTERQAADRVPVCTTLSAK